MYIYTSEPSGTFVVQHLSIFEFVFAACPLLHTNIVFFCHRQNRDRFSFTQVEAMYPDQIKVFYSAKCDSIEQLPGGGGIEVKAHLRVGGDQGEGAGGETKVFRPRLLVGADGLKSTVNMEYVGSLP